MSWSAQAAEFRQLSKSGIVTLVLITVCAGFLVGLPQGAALAPGRMLGAVLGVLLLASGSSAWNQLQERFIDARMKRTASRPLPSGRMTPAAASAFIVVALIGGLALLASISLPVLLLGLTAVFLYNGLYTCHWKKHWAHAAIPGAIPGAIPIVIGYAASSSQVFSPAALYLFLLLFYWQMPHFWVLALHYRRDYAAGGIPTLPVACGEKLTVLEIALWTLGWCALLHLAPYFLPVGRLYQGGAFVATGWICVALLRYSKAPSSSRWLEFFLSVNFALIVLLALAVVDVLK